MYGLAKVNICMRKENSPHCHLLLCTRMLQDWLLGSGEVGRAANVRTWKEGMAEHTYQNINALHEDLFDRAVCRGGDHMPTYTFQNHLHYSIKYLRVGCTSGRSDRTLRRQTARLICHIFLETYSLTSSWNPTGHLSLQPAASTSHALTLLSAPSPQPRLLSSQHFSRPPPDPNPLIWV